jgi:hypothetical protein
MLAATFSLCLVSQFQILTRNRSAAQSLAKKRQRRLDCADGSRGSLNRALTWSKECSILDYISGVSFLHDEPPLDTPLARARALLNVRVWLSATQQWRRESGVHSRMNSLFTRSPTARSASFAFLLARDETGMTKSCHAKSA